MKSRVIQLSVRGPLFFLLYVQDLDLSIQHSRISKHADDMEVFTAFQRNSASQTKCKEI